MVSTSVYKISSRPLGRQATRLGLSYWMKLVRTVFKVLTRIHHVPLDLSETKAW